MLRAFLLAFATLMILIVGAAFYVNEWVPHCSEITFTCSSVARSVAILKVGTVVSLILAICFAIDWADKPWNQNL